MLQQSVVKSNGVFIKIMYENLIDHVRKSDWVFIKIIYEKFNGVFIEVMYGMIWYCTELYGPSEKTECKEHRWIPIRNIVSVSTFLNDFAGNFF